MFGNWIWAGPGGGMGKTPFSLVFWVSLVALRAFTKRPQVFQGKNAGIVAVAPGDLVGIVTHRGDLHGAKRYEFAGLEDAERVGRLFAFFLATGARAMIAQVLPVVDAAMAVIPLDNQAVFAVLAQAQRPQGARHGIHQGDRKKKKTLG
jgi:hypothetical protein